MSVKSGTSKHSVASKCNYLTRGFHSKAQSVSRNRKRDFVTSVDAPKASLEYIPKITGTNDLIGKSHKRHMQTIDMTQSLLENFDKAHESKQRSTQKIILDELL